MHCGDQRHLGLCLGYVPALATARAGSPTKAQPCVPLISTMHGQPFLIPLTVIICDNATYCLHLQLNLIKTTSYNKSYTNCVHTLWDILQTASLFQTLMSVHSLYIQWWTMVADVGCRYYNDVIMGAIASLITNITIVYSTVYSDADQRKHQSSAPLAFVWGIHRGPVNSPHKWPVTRKMFPFYDVTIGWKLIGPWEMWE